MSYTITTPQSGFFPIASTDSGITYTFPAGSTSIIATPPAAIGTVVKAFDPTYGEGEFICLKGKTGTVVGSVVVYNDTTGATTLSLGATHANSARPVAVAMSANTSSVSYGWYQVKGSSVIKKTAVKFSPGVKVFLGTGTGRLSASGSGKQLMGAFSLNTATVASATSTLNVVINRPHVQGQTI